MKKWSFPEYEKCDYPNLAAEIHMHNAGHPITYADHANITLEVLENFLQGNGDITEDEFFRMARLTTSLTNVPYSYDYLLCRTTSYYDLMKTKHYRKFVLAYAAFNKAKSGVMRKFDTIIENKIPPFEEVVQRRIVSRAFFNNILRLTESIECSKQIVEKKPRRAIINIE